MTVSPFATLGAVSAVRRLVRPTIEPIQFLDITHDIQATVASLGLLEGIVTVYSRHTTAAVRVQEHEPLLLEDLRAFLERCAPPAAAYRHNDFHVRTVNMHPDERPNGHAHCLHLLLGTSETVPIVAGELQLGTWQRIFLVELDGPRHEREVLVHLLGARADEPGLPHNRANGHACDAQSALTEERPCI